MSRRTAAPCRPLTEERVRSLIRQELDHWKRHGFTAADEARIVELIRHEIAPLEKLATITAGMLPKTARRGGTGRPPVPAHKLAHARELRAKGATIDAAAKEAGISPGTLANELSGKRKVRVRVSNAGRPPLDPRKVERALELRAGGATIAAAARQAEISESTLKRALCGHR